MTPATRRIPSDWMPGVSWSSRSGSLHGRFPDGPRDAEGLFLGPAGDLYLVNKRRSEAVGLYRYPSPHHPGEMVTLERVRTLFPQPDARPAYVTTATSTPNGNWVGILADDGTVWVTSEADDDSASPRWSQLRCSLPAT